MLCDVVGVCVCYVTWVVCVLCDVSGVCVMRRRVAVLVLWAAPFLSFTTASTTFKTGRNGWEGL